MTKGFLLLVLCSSAMAFAGTWLVTGDPAPGGITTLAGDQAPRLSSCEEALEKGLAPIYAGSPDYSPELDPDGDGLACPPA